MLILTNVQYNLDDGKLCKCSNGLLCEIFKIFKIQFNFFWIALSSCSINFQILVKGTITFTIFFLKFLAWFILLDFIFLYFLLLALQIIVQRSWTHKCLRYRFICQNAVIKISIFYVCMKLFQRITLPFIWEAPFKMWTWH